MKIVYIASPLAGDIQNNIQKALGYCRMAVSMGVVPLAPHTIFTRLLDDNDPEQRRLGMKMGYTLLERCDELWVFGSVLSAGMKAEITYAEKLGMPVRYFDGDVREAAR
jgi:hypothetical protein